MWCKTVPFGRALHGYVNLSVSGDTVTGTCEEPVFVWPVAEPTPAARQALRERAAQARQHGMLAIAEAVSTNTVSDASHAKNPIISAFVRESLMRQDANGYAMHCEALALAVAADHKRIQCPVQLVAGDVDSVVPLEQVRLLASQLVNAEITELEQVAHWMTLEATQQCSACLLQQLNSFKPLA